MLLASLVLFFFPHPDNNHRARLLNPILIAITILMFVLTQFGLSFVPKFTPIVLGYVSNITPEDIVTLTNSEREKSGLNQLKVDPQLAQAALKKANYMFEKDYWAHTAPDGTEPWAFVTNAGYKYRFAGENLARDFATPEAVVAAWIDSPTHKDNLMSSRYQDIGVAVVEGDLNGVQTTLIVQMFGTKMTKVVAEETTPTNNPELSQLAENQNPSSQVAGSNEEKKPFIISPFSTNKNLSILLISVFLLVVTIDMIIVNRANVQRATSRSFAHFLFFGMIIVAIIASKAGNVL